MKKVIALCLSFLAPVLAFAQTTPVTNISSGFKFATALFNNITIFIFGLAVVWFLWGVFKYVVASAGDEEAHKAARNMVIQGIIGLAVMLSVYGLISFLTSSLNLNNNAVINVPQVQTPNNN